MSNERQIYEIFFNLTRDPFSLEPELDFLYLSEKVGAFLLELYEQIRLNSAFVVVFGEPGLGKTMLVHKIVADLEKFDNFTHIVTVECPVSDWDVKEFLVTVLKKDGISADEGKSLQAMVEAWLVKLIEGRELKRVLLVDSAHNLRTKNALELLRTFNSLSIGNNKLINIVLFAEPEWENQFEKLGGFRDLITLRFDLEPLTQEDVRNFIRLRLERCGYNDANGPIFDESAYVVLYAYTRGHPKRLLQVLRSVFTELASKGEKVVSSRVILENIDKRFQLSSVDRVRIARALLNYDMTPNRREEINKLPTKELEKWQRDIKSVEILLKEYESKDI